MRGKPRDRGGGGILGAGRIAKVAFGARQRRARIRVDSLRLGQHVFGAGEPRGGAFERACRFRRRGTQHIEPIGAHEPFGGGRALAPRDIAVPTAQRTVTRHQPLADGEDDPAVIAFNYADLRKAARKRRRRIDVVGERLATRGQRGIVGARLGPGPAPRRGFAKPRFEIVAERRGKRRFIARRRPNMRKRAITTRL